MWTSAVILSVLVAGSWAIVCTPEMCAGVEQEKLNCQGEVIKGGGFCGCSDVCAGVEGEDCAVPTEKSSLFLGVAPRTRCSKGFECVKKEVAAASMLVLPNASNGACKKKKPTQCEQTRMLRMISFAIWKGQWTPRCDSVGNFMPRQCDNTGACFCVTALQGTVIVGSKKQSLDVTC